MTKTGTAGIIEAIRNDYRDNGAGMMPLLWIRGGEHTSRFAKVDVEATLRLLASGASPARDIAIEEMTNQKTLTENERRAGIRIGGVTATHIVIN